MTEHTPGPWSVMNTHTPGPWIVGASPLVHLEDHYDNCDEVQNEVTRETVAYVPLAVRKRVDGGVSAAPAVHGYANTRLITAAPELLAALKAILQITDGSQPRDYPSVPWIAQAAIRTATGR